MNEASQELCENLCELVRKVNDLIDALNYKKIVIENERQILEIKVCDFHISFRDLYEDLGEDDGEWSEEEFFDDR